MKSPEGEALFAKGKKLFASCAAGRDHACVLGYLQHNLEQGGWRAETARRLIEWLRELSEQRETGHEHARAILASLRQKRILPRPRPRR